MVLYIKHPRPDFRRLKWINLSGKWLFQFDERETLKPDSLQNEDSFEDEINVPYPYQSELSGIAIEKEVDVVWYGKRFKISQAELSQFKTALLNFGAVDYETHVWLNGKYLGSHIGGFDSFQFDISEVLKEENFLLLKIIDRHRDQPRGKQAEKGKQPAGIIYTRVTGIWQPVWIDLIKDKPYITQILVNPHINGRVDINLNLSTEAERLSAEVSFIYGGASLDVYNFDFSEKNKTFSMDIEDPSLWSPDDPQLYDIDITLMKDGVPVDTISSYFGFRSIEVKGDKILLNGKILYLQQVLDQGFYPEGIYTPKDPDVFLQDLKNILELGFNGVRAHQKPPDPRYLYFADSLGILVWEEMGDWGMSLTKKNLPIFLQQWKNIIKRDINHPSVITWVPLNERAEISNNEEAREFAEAVYNETKSVDSTRPVVDASGWTHVKTDIYDVHDYLYSLQPGALYAQILVDEEWKAFMDGTEELDFGEQPFKTGLQGAYQQQPVVISEFGGWGIENQKPIVNRPRYSYAYLPDSFRLESKFRDVTTAIASTRYISGYCYTQLYDVEGEINGLLTYDRKWKVQPHVIKAINVNAKKKWIWENV